MRSRVAAPVRRTLVAVLCTAGLVVASGCGSDEPKSQTEQSTSASPTSTKPKKIQVASTFKTIDGLPKDKSTAETDGTVVHPKMRTDVYDAPGGDVAARLPVKELGNPTWVPVVEKKSGWLRVLLPSRPNGSTGWIKDSGGLEKAASKHVVKVDVDARKLTLEKDGAPVGSWSVAVGTDKTPTPRTRTFLMASIIDAKQAKYTPIVLPLGAHSDTLDTFGGGPGTVAIHGWTTDSSVFGKAVSNGCIRVPSDGLKELRSVPLGSLVIIQ